MSMGSGFLDLNELDYYGVCGDVMEHDIRMVRTGNNLEHGMLQLIQTTPYLVLILIATL